MFSEGLNELLNPTIRERRWSCVFWSKKLENLLQNKKRIC
jgi:hypothetical protein